MEPLQLINESSGPGKTLAKYEFRDARLTICEPCLNNLGMFCSCIICAYLFHAKGLIDLERASPGLLQVLGESEQPHEPTHVS